MVLSTSDIRPLMAIAVTLGMPVSSLVGDAVAASADVVDNYQRCLPFSTFTAISALAGKTTLLSLVLGLYEVGSGRILLDGVDIHSLEPREVRRAVAYVEQDAPAFWGSFWENVTYGVDGAAPEGVAEVVASLGLDSLVRRLPQGLETSIGDRGSLLSGGERQRVAIARRAAAHSFALCKATSLGGSGGRSQRGGEQIGCVGGCPEVTAAPLRCRGVHRPPESGR